MSSVLPARLVAQLRVSLATAAFTVSGVEALVGHEEHLALARNETTPAWRKTADGSALSTLVRLWPLQAPVPRAHAEAALPGLVEPLCAAGVLERSGEEVRASIDIRPYADDDRDWWIVSDLAPGLDGAGRRMRADHVLGVTSATTTLAQIVVRDEGRSALDLGTGSGVQAMHLSRHVSHLVATDVNPRCLRLAAMTAALNDVELDLRLGNLYEPVAADRFDVIVANPPFVVSPGTQERLVYRDSGLPGDEVVRRVVTQSAAHLEDGGWCHVLANWVHGRDEPWHERVGGWVAATGCDAWVVQREVTDAARYVELWLDDAGLHGAPDYTRRYDAWLAWFGAQHIEAVGFGWLSLRNAGRDTPVATVEDWPFEVMQPLGPHVRSWAGLVDLLHRRDDDNLLAARMLTAPDVVEERVGRPGDVDPTAIVLRQRLGMRRARLVTTAVAAMVGACDGELTLGQIASALAGLLDSDAVSVRAELCTASRQLILDGILTLT